jgi:hypothetical protein
MSVGKQKFCRSLLKYTLLTSTLLLCCLFMSTPAHAATGVNQQINFQGRLLNSQGATVPDGLYNIEFKIYQDGDGQSAADATGVPAGSLKWTEDYLNVNTQGITVKNGFLSVQLGSVNPFAANVNWNQDTLWLSMNVASTGAACTPFASCTPDGEMTPLKRLSSNVYSLNSGLLNGLSGSQFIQLAQGLQTDASASTNSIYINKTASGNLLDLQSSGTDAFVLANNGDASFGANANHTLSVITAGTGVAGKSLTVSGGSAGSGSTVAGGNLILQGGLGSGTGQVGSVIIKANTSNSTSVLQVQNAAGTSLLNIDSVNKVVSLGTGLTQPVPTMATPIVATVGGTIPTGTTYYYGVTAVAGGSETEISPVVAVAVASATNTNQVSLSWSSSFGATGYKIYRNTTNNFTSGSLLLATISSGSTLTYTDTGTAQTAGLPPSAYISSLLRVDNAANNPFSNGQTALLGSIYYNTTSGEFQCYKNSGVGGSWSDCGVTTLQGAYNNGASTSTVPQVKLDASHGTFNLQDSDTSIGADLLDVRASNGAGLGAVQFGIGTTGTVTVQNATDQNSSLRVLTQSGQYLLNANTASGYLISNAIRPLSGQLSNPSFESGGSITSGEEGWNGSAQASIVNSSANAHGGNYVLQVTPNGTALKTYGGTYYSVTSGDVVYFEGWTKTGASNGTGGVLIEGYDKDKNLISSSTDSASLPGTSYVLKATNYTVPSTVKYVRVAALVNAGATTGTYYFDDFTLNDSQRGQQLFQNTADTTTAFMIQSANAAQTLFTADTTNNLLKVGDSTGTDIATTLLVLDSTTANPTTNLSAKNGGLFYRSDNNTLKAVIGGAVVDICTTAVTCSGYSASAGSTIQLQSSSPGATQTGNFNITGTGILTQLQTQDQSALSTNSSNLTIRSGNATGATSNSGNIILDVGTATSTTGNISIGHSGVITTLGGTLVIQSANTLSLGTSSSATASILFSTSAGANTITLKAPGSNPSSSWNLVLPQNPGNSGDCLKDSSGTGTLAFGNCAAGLTVNLQNTYDNSSSPATITLADSKDLRFVAQDTTTDPNILFNLQCVVSCGSNGRFSVQNSGTDVLTVSPNGGGIILNTYTQIGSSTTDGTQVNFQLDSSNAATDSGTCTTTQNQGALYYNTTMGSIRSCINGSWGDVSNPDTLGLLTFGIVPSSGTNPYDLPALVVPAVSGPCKVSWASSTTVSIQSCVAYSGGRRVNVSAATLSTNVATAGNINLTTGARWGHICLTGTNKQPAFTTTTGQATALAGQPTFSVTAPILCLADVLGSPTTAGNISSLYDLRTYTSSLKEAVNTSTASDLGMIVDASGANGAMVPAATASQKLYGLVVATDGSTSAGAPNAIVTTTGSGYVKAISGTAGQFVISSATSGYASTTASIPNNSFYYSAGNTRSTYASTCTSSATCTGSLYVNFIVR